MSVAMQLPILAEDGGEFDRRVAEATGGKLAACAIETIQVNIPAGVDSGSRVRVPGKGNAGRFGGASSISTATAATYHSRR